MQADAVLGNAAAGFSAEEIPEQIFEGVPVERLRAVLRFAEALGFHPLGSN